MKDYRAVLLDLDGVIYRGEQVLPGARELVAWLDATGRRALYLSNNSLATPAEVTAKLARLGLPRPQGRVLTAGGLAAQVLARRFPGGRVYVLAMPAIAGLVAELGLHLAWQETEAGPVPDAWTDRSRTSASRAGCVPCLGERRSLLSIAIRGYPWRTASNWEQALSRRRWNTRVGNQLRSSASQRLTSL